MRVARPVFFIMALLILGLTYVAFRGVDTFIGSMPIEIKGANSMRFGIDIRGGVEAYYKPVDNGSLPTGSDMDRALESARLIIETRLDYQGIYDRDVTIDKTNKNILVRFPWKANETNFDPGKAIQELGSMAKLTFVEGTLTEAADGKYEDGSGTRYNITDEKVVIEGSNVVDATYVTQNTDNMVELKLDANGAVAFENATARLINKPIHIIMDTLIISSPTVKDKIVGDTAYITQISSSKDAIDLANKIKAGALPFALTSESHSTISPTLGSGALKVMEEAGLIAFILVCLFMLFYYRLPGFVACLALLLQTTGQLLCVSIPQFSLTLPGIAGIILSIGMGVDANIIIAERIKEEIRGGKTLSNAIDTGFLRAFSAVLDGNATVAIVAILLMIFGSGSMWSFGYSLLTGVILNQISGVAASRLMIKSLSGIKLLRIPFLFGDRRVKQ